MKHLSIALLLVFSSLNALAQNENRFKYYFNGAFGAYLPVKAQDALSKRGSVYTFQFQTNFKDNYFARFFFDQNNISYKDVANISGVNVSIDDYVQTNTFGIDIGYSFFEKSKLSYFVYLGAGTASLRVPIIGYNEEDNTGRISKSSKSFLNLRGGIGIEYEFSRVFILYLDVQYTSIPFKTDLSNKQLNGVTPIIGFKTPLQ